MKDSLDLERKMLYNLDNIYGIIGTIKTTKEYEREVNKEIERISAQSPVTDETEYELKSLRTQREIHEKCITSHIEVLDHNVETLKSDCTQFVELTGGNETSDMVEGFLSDYDNLNLID